MKKFILSAAAFLLSSAGASYASTYYSHVEAGICEETQEDVISTSVNCGKASAFSLPGWLGARVTTGLGSAVATARFSDTLYFGIERGTFTIPLDFFGTVNTMVEVFHSEYISSAKSLALATGQAGSPFYGESDGFSYLSFKEAHKVDRTYTADSYNNGTSFLKTEVVAEIIDGQVQVFGELDLQANCVVFAAMCNASADYSNSLRFLGGTVRDLDGNIRNDVSVTSDSGFDYRVGRPPHDIDIAPVPLPASAWLLAGSLLGLVRYRRRQRLSA